MAFDTERQHEEDRTDFAEAMVEFIEGDDLGIFFPLLDAFCRIVEGGDFPEAAEACAEWRNNQDFQEALDKDD